MTLGAPAGSPEASTAHPWTIVIRNQGIGTANIYLVAVQGYYSTNSTYGDSDDDPACGDSLSQVPGTTLAPGATVEVVVGCGAPRTRNYLVAKVDVGNDVAEGDETNNVGVLSLT